MIAIACLSLWQCWLSKCFQLGCCYHCLVCLFVCHLSIRARFTNVDQA